jgi:formylglycine-generating enzyme required for sulfatase activity
MACRVQSTPTAPTARSADPAIEITTAGGITMMLIPSGTFSMGSDTGEADERPRHEVTLSAYAIDKFEVTQDQFAALELPDPSHFKDPKRPVEQVRWSDAADFCNLRSLEEGLDPCYDELTYECNFDASGYRLPTEAEWERAARAASTGDRPVENAKEPIGGFACYAGNSRKKTALVGKKKPNAWGIYDMQGNVLEWCNDFYGEDYYEASPPRDPRGAADGKKRVLRGGSWNASAGACRVSARFADAPGLTDACFARDTYGFRCVRKLTAEEVTME